MKRKLTVKKQAIISKNNILILNQKRSSLYIERFLYLCKIKIQIANLAIGKINSEIDQ